RPEPLRAVALLELLARAAPARVVAADLLVLADRPLRRDRASSGEPGRRDRAAETFRSTRGRDHVGARRGVVLVGEVAVRTLAVRRRRRAQLLAAFAGLELRVEGRQHDLLADREAELLEHHVP